MRIQLFVFFFNDTATTEIYTLSLHDALPISSMQLMASSQVGSLSSSNNISKSSRRSRSSSTVPTSVACTGWPDRLDRKSTRLNSSHQIISYAVFCLKKKTTNSNAVSTSSSTL